MILAIKRLTAYVLDFLILACTLVSLQWGLYSLTSGFPFNHFQYGWQIELWVLGTISLPVWLYFILMEKSQARATLGKKCLKLIVFNSKGERITSKQAFLRTFIRLLPWELTHLVILLPTPWWWTPGTPSNLFSLWIIDGMILLYVIILFWFKGKKGMHDFISKTEVILKSES